MQFCDAYTVQPSVKTEDVDVCTLTPPRSYYTPSPQNDQQQLQHDQKQQYNTYPAPSWSHQYQSSNYYDSNYYPAIRGHSSTMEQQPVAQNPPQYPILCNASISNSSNVLSGLPQQPRIKPQRTRAIYTAFQLLELEGVFATNKYVRSRAERIALSLKLGMTEKQIKNWFQNRRMKLKKTENASTCNCTYSASTSSNLSYNTPSIKNEPFNDDIEKTVEISEPHLTNF